MTDNEIIKALEKVLTIGDAPIGEYWGCAVTTKLVKDTLVLINYQRVEIERLKELLGEWKTAAYKVADEKDELYCNAVYRVRTAKAEAIKEFAERLFDECLEYPLSNEDLTILVNRRNFEELVKEMVGEG